MRKHPQVILIGGAHTTFATKLLAPDVPNAAEFGLPPVGTGGSWYGFRGGKDFEDFVRDGVSRWQRALQRVGKK